jgi:hypothetical protein
MDGGVDGDTPACTHSWDQLTADFLNICIVHDAHANMFDLSSQFRRGGCELGCGLPKGNQCLGLAGPQRYVQSRLDHPARHRSALATQADESTPVAHIQHCSLTVP